MKNIKISLFMFLFLMQFENNIYSRYQEVLNFDESDKLRLKKIISEAACYYFEIIRTISIPSLDEKKKSNMIENYKNEIFRLSIKSLEELQSKKIKLLQKENLIYSDKTILYNEVTKFIDIKNPRNLFTDIHTIEYRESLFIGSNMFEDFENAYYDLKKQAGNTYQMSKIKNRYIDESLVNYNKKIAEIKYFIIKHELNRKNSNLNYFLNKTGSFGSVLLATVAGIVLVEKFKNTAYSNDKRLVISVVSTAIFGSITYGLINQIEIFDN